MNDIDAARARKRLTEGRALAAVIINHMQKEGVTAELFGSMQTGDVFPTSDVDILVTDRGGLDRAIIEHKIELIPKVISVDVVFLEDVPADSLARIEASRDSANSMACWLSEFINSEKFKRDFVANLEAERRLLDKSPLVVAADHGDTPDDLAQRQRCIDGTTGLPESK